MKRYWLMKTEPEVFSFEDLVKAPRRTTSWEGVRNYQARNFMRDDFKRGDEVLIYHSNSDEAGIYGVAEVVKENHPDLTALDPKSEYYDEKATKKGDNPWRLVDVRATARFTEPVTRPRLQAEPRLSKMMVLQRGARLSVQPVTPEEFKIICSLGGPIPI